MQAYVGDTRSRVLLARLAEAGVGQVCLRGRVKPRLHPWFYDNGAFEDHKAGRPFDATQFEADLEAVNSLGAAFLVLPDRVADRNATLALADAWLPRCAEVAPCYFAVQNGMTASDVPWTETAGIFLGGTLDWKLQTAAYWRGESQAHGKNCHFARCGTRRRVGFAMALRCDSLDSSLPLWSSENMRAFEDALRQMPLFYENLTGLPPPITTPPPEVLRIAQQIARAVGDDYEVSVSPVSEPDQVLVRLDRRA